MTVPDRVWRPAGWRRWAYTAGALVAVLGAVLTGSSSDSSFRSGAGPALVAVAGVLAVLAGLDLWHGTPLVAGTTGIRLSRGPGRSETVPWADIERIEATSSASRGVLRLISLEIDFGDRLVLLSRHRLGADPAEVAAELTELRAAVLS